MKVGMDRGRRGVMGHAVLVVAMALMGGMLGPSVLAENGRVTSGQGDLPNLEAVLELLEEIRDLQMRIEARLQVLEEAGDYYSIKLFNVDDVVTVSVNERRAVECRWLQVCYLRGNDIEPFLEKGRENVVVIELGNARGKYAFGYEVWRNGVLLHADSCGSSIGGNPGCGRYPRIARRGITELLRFIIDRR